MCRKNNRNLVISAVLAVWCWPCRRCYAVAHHVLFTAYRSNNFIVGLTNDDPRVSLPTLWNYTLCGRYPGVVPAGATASVYCPHNIPPFRYVIVQVALTNDAMNFCELEVIAPGTDVTAVRICYTWWPQKYAITKLWKIVLKPANEIIFIRLINVLIRHYVIRWH